MTATRRPSRLLERMRENPQGDWTIADIERLCREVGLTVTPPRRRSHYNVRDPGSGATLTIPAHRPVRPVYISALVALADRFREQRDGTLRPLGAADGGGWLAEVPELPGCMSDGETPQQAIENVMDAIACWIEAAEEDGRPVPSPASADAA